MSNEVPKADGLKAGEVGQTAIDGLLAAYGAPPRNRAKRKRSFWRAVRRGDCWAVMSLENAERLRKLVYSKCPFEVKPSIYVNDYTIMIIRSDE